LGINDSSSFRRIDEFEKSVEIYEQGKKSRSRKSSSDRKSSRSNSSVVKFDNSIHLNQVSIEIDDVDLSRMKDEKIVKDIDMKFDE
jgi:hypothetical protein